MKILSFRQIFDNFSEPDNFQDIATYFIVRGQEIKTFSLVFSVAISLRQFIMSGEKLS